MDTPFVTLIDGFISTRHLLQKGEKVILGLSGGADSVALLVVMQELGYDCVAAHCNFHLRGEESNRDERFCRELCDKMNVKLLVNNFDVHSSRKATGESVEMACRTLRYEWWNSLLQSGEGSVIAVGHHKEDNVETFFINMLRGSGLNGLKGMLPKSGNVIRPLLSVSRLEIEQYLTSKSLDYVNDSTNAENEFRRNKLRNIILPELERLFPGAMDSVSRTISCLQDNYNLYNDCIEGLREKYVSSDKGINLSKIVTDEPHARMVLFELMSPLGFNMTQVANILSSFTEEGYCQASGRKFVSSVTTMLLDRGYLRPVHTSGDTYLHEPRNVSLSDKPFSSLIISKEEFDKMKNSHTLHSNSLYLDVKILDTPHDFSIRRWRSGDRFSPFGMKGSKLLSDLFNDCKMPVDVKETIPVLLCDDKIIWVIGIRSSRDFAVTSDTKQVLVVTYNPE